MIIKVCGMREGTNIRAVESLGIDWMGLIFWPRSGRYVSERPDYLPRQAKRVGVFVDEDPETIKQIAEDYALDLIQLHGHESPEQISHLSKATGRRASGNPLTSYLSIIKAFSIATAEDLAQVSAYEGVVDYFLFDTKGPSVGGNGTQFDWQVLAHYHGPEDAERIRAFHHPQCIGIDLNSRFEQAPGLKDVQKLKTFIQSL